MSRYKVIKHGTMYVSKHEPIVCPECASEMIKSDRKSEIDDVFFRLIRRTRTYSCLICFECGCEMQKLEKIQIKTYKLFRKILLSLLFIALTIFTGKFVVYSFGDCEIWVGVLGILAIPVAIFMVVWDIGYVCNIISDIISNKNNYRE